MKRSATAIALTLSLAFIPSPAKPNPAATLAIPACASFLPGCVVLGTVAIAGSLYWVYQDAKGLWVAPIIDPENPEGWELGEEMTVTAENEREARDLCKRAARRYGKTYLGLREAGETIGGGKTYVCRFR
ncbi:hypothetical protein PMG71_05770 [Roseofilum sp. BLCC_M154]|uniref:DUF4189 domain-containing protein n=1 Tax=Roseofilum acuticapitatum BLCC-M154 TaxID=3022444 RepID=A0ABT7APV0_9CYAN|nr:hypothetical protein [Roseofilum acuticapitatum]MDJ1168928.1 hypothetical protein [Roseofilum acuticapitatum BLCC-M154]